MAFTERSFSQIKGDLIAVGIAGAVLIGPACHAM